MTVKELIEALEPLEADRPVMILWHNYLREVIGALPITVDDLQVVLIDNKPFTA